MKLSFEIQPWELKLMFDLVKSDQLEDEEELDDDDAEDEQCCCDDLPAETCEYMSDEQKKKVIKRSLEEAEKYLRSCNIPLHGGIDITYAIRHDNKR